MTDITPLNLSKHHDKKIYNDLKSWDEVGKYMCDYYDGLYTYIPFPDIFERSDKEYLDHLLKIKPHIKELTLCGFIPYWVDTSYKNDHNKNDYDKNDILKQPGQKYHTRPHIIMMVEKHKADKLIDYFRLIPNVVKHKTIVTLDCEDCDLEHVHNLSNTNTDTSKNILSYFSSVNKNMKEYYDYTNYTETEFGINVEETFESQCFNVPINLSIDHFIVSVELAGSRFDDYDGTFWNQLVDYVKNNNDNDNDNSLITGNDNSLITGNDNSLITGNDNSLITGNDKSLITYSGLSDDENVLELTKSNMDKIRRERQLYHNISNFNELCQYGYNICHDIYKYLPFYGVPNYDRRNLYESTTENNLTNYMATINQLGFFTTSSQPIEKQTIKRHNDSMFMPTYMKGMVNIHRFQRPYVSGYMSKRNIEKVLELCKLSNHIIVGENTHMTLFCDDSDIEYIHNLHKDDDTYKTIIEYQQKKYNFVHHDLEGVIARKNMDTSEHYNSRLPEKINVAKLTYVNFIGKRFDDKVNNFWLDFIKILKQSTHQ
jgi:hypothetical protein